MTKLCSDNHFYYLPFPFIGEIDAVILAVLVGVPHPDWGEAVADAVKLQDSVSLLSYSSSPRDDKIPHGLPKLSVGYHVSICVDSGTIYSN